MELVYKHYWAWNLQGAWILLVYRHYFCITYFIGIANLKDVPIYICQATRHPTLVIINRFIKHLQKINHRVTTLRIPLAFFCSVGLWVCFMVSLCTKLLSTTASIGSIIPFLISSTLKFRSWMLAYASLSMSLLYWHPLQLWTFSIAAICFQLWYSLCFFQRHLIKTK